MSTPRPGVSALAGGRPAARPQAGRAPLAPPAHPQAHIHEAERPYVERAEAAGRLAAMDCLSEPDSIVERIAAAALRDGYRFDPHGLRTRLAWAFNDAMRRAEERREAAALAVRRVARGHLSCWAPFCDVLAAARAEAERHGDVLLAHEVRALVEAETAEFLGRGNA